MNARGLTIESREGVVTIPLGTSGVALAILAVATGLPLARVKRV